jgi:hypothetical protein
MNEVSTSPTAAQFSPVAKPGPRRFISLPEFRERFSISPERCEVMIDEGDIRV